MDTLKLKTGGLDYCILSCRLEAIHVRGMWNDFKGCSSATGSVPAFFRGVGVEIVWKMLVT